MMLIVDLSFTCDNLQQQEKHIGPKTGAAGFSLASQLLPVSKNCRWTHTEYMRNQAGVTSDPKVTSCGGPVAPSTAGE